uniref:Uncharacterized protein n=1 Tax=Avena sativa TaxID=4498 RepID=A0ACD5UE16_AVESA
MSYASSSRSSRHRNIPLIPYIPYPDCGKIDKRFTSGTLQHNGWVFYECLKHAEFEYVMYLLDNNVLHGEDGIGALGRAEDMGIQGAIHKQKRGWGWGQKGKPDGGSLAVPLYSNFPRPPRRRLLLGPPTLSHTPFRFLPPPKLVFLATTYLSLQPARERALCRSIDMAKNTCKLCSRRFASPRALAGHMRSHSMAVARSQISSASSASTSLAPGDDDAAAAAKNAVQGGYVLRDKPKRRVRLAEADFSDRESEAEYPSPSPPDAKRAHVGSGDYAEPVSSVSDAATPEEDVARSLMMLSRDSWPAAPWPYAYSDSDDDDKVLVQKRTEFQCPACKKVFRSYQALGGHRASHVRGGRGGCCAPLPPPPAHLQPLAECDGGAEENPKPAHVCPYCFRAFASGKALGGHKRSQLCSAAAVVAASGAAAAAIKGLDLIDLNLPAPFEDVELSAVSDPFLSSKKPAS